MLERLTAGLRLWATARWFDPALAGVLAAASVVSLLPGVGSSSSSGATVFALLICAPVALMRRSAGAAAGAGAVVLASSAFVPTEDYPSVSLLVFCVLSYACGTRARPPAGAVGVGVLLASLLLAFGIADGAWVPLLLWTLGPWLAGRTVRSRRELVAALAQQTREIEAEKDEFTRLAVRRERARIAHELHDIVAHNLAVVVIHAGAGRMASPGSTRHATERFASIRGAAGQALTDLARLVDVLHADDRPDDYRRRLHVALDQARAAGLNVRATSLTRSVELSGELGSTAHRVVQEGLTNALKHASGADVHVHFALDDGILEIEVRDSGGQPWSTLADTGAGLGLAGLSEEVTAVGGHLEAAPAPGRGWRLRAQLPVGHGPVAATE